MTRPANIEGIEAATKMTWDKWLDFLTKKNAKDLNHKELAQTIYNKLGEQQPSRGWWAQTVAVAYEQHIGRRQPGQRPDGTYELSVSKTLEGTIDEAMHTWISLVKDAKDFSGIAILGKPKLSKTEKWRHWRVRLADGTVVIVNTSAKAGTSAKSASKTGLTITHTKLATAELAQQWRSFWKEYLSRQFRK